MPLRLCAIHVGLSQGGCVERVLIPPQRLIHPPSAPEPTITVNDLRRKPFNELTENAPGTVMQVAAAAMVSPRFTVHLLPVDDCNAAPA